MTVLAELLPLLIQAEPYVQEAVLALIKIIQDQRAGTLDAAAAKTAADQALLLMMGRNADPVAQDAADLAAVDAEARAKFQP